jgi:hypothetical protein
MTDAPRPALYHALGNGGLFCRLCLATIVPDPPTETDPLGVRMHERANTFRHREYQKAADERDRPRLD